MFQCRSPDNEFPCYNQSTFSVIAIGSLSSQPHESPPLIGGPEERQDSMNLSLNIAYGPNGLLFLLFIPVLGGGCVYK